MVSMLREIGSPEIGEYIMKSYFDVATNGTGLYVREVRENDTTVYCDRVVESFDSESAAYDFANTHDEEYWVE